MRFVVLVLSILSIGLFVLPGAAFTQWTNDPLVNTPIAVAAQSQRLPVAVSDGEGGGIVVWQDFRSNSYYELYAQRVNAAGVLLWTSGGVVIRDLSTGVTDVDVVSDGAGGAIVVWTDQRNASADIYAQRISAAGVVQWALNGVAICTDASAQGTPAIVEDGIGGAVIAWLDARGGSDLYGQRINGNGTVSWTANGVNLTPVPSTIRYPPELITDGARGAIVVWQDYNSDFKALAQRVDSTGTIMWDSGAVQLNTPNFSTDVDPLVVADGAGGAIITWIQDVGILTHIFAQRLDPSGVELWTPLGEDLGPENSHAEMRMCASGQGRAIILWNDDNDMDAVSIDTSANWTGFRVASDLSDVGYPGVAANGNGGWTVIWGEFEPGPDEDIRATAVDADGDPLWGPLYVTSNPADIHNAVVISDQDSGTITLWEDYRSGFATRDIYGQRILGDGSYPTTLSGLVYHDLLADDGRNLPEDTVQVGWNVFIREEGGGYIDSTTTSPAGVYAFTALPAGNYLVYEEPPAPWYQVTPSSPDSFDVDYNPGDDDVTGLNFGNVYGYRYIGAPGGAWSVPANWTGGTVPDSEDVVVVPTSVVVDNLPNETILALIIEDGGTLTFTSGAPDVVVKGSVIIDDGGSLVYPGSLDIPGEAAGSSSVPTQMPGATGPSVAYTLTCHGNWIDDGSLTAGASTVILAGDSTFISGSTTFNSLTIAGAAVASGPTTPESGPEASFTQTIAGELTLERSFIQRANDSIIVLNPLPGAIVDTGRIERGTIVRSIQQSETGSYRFESALTFIQFDGAGTYPASMGVTTTPDTIPPSFDLTWLLVGGTPNPATNTVVADSVTGFSRWVLGRPKATSLGTPEVGRIYSIEPDGGSGFYATVQLRYEDAEVFGGVPEAQLQLLRGPFSVDSVEVRWNLVSVPVIVEDYQTDSLFPGTSSDAFSYNGNGYQTHTTLQNGPGYWLKFTTGGEVAIFGDPIETDTIDVLPGWNLIGSISSPVAVSSVQSIPPGLLTSGFYSYNAGYTPADTVEPGNGYWLRSDDSGKIILSAAGVIEPASRLVVSGIAETPPPPPAGDVPGADESRLTSGAPTAYALEQNYPNPFNPSTSIRFRIPEAGWVRLKVYDVIGREVAVLVDAVRVAGDFTQTFDASGLTSGIYYVKMTAGRFSDVRKMAVVK